MLFNTFQFLIFIIPVIVIYYLLNLRLRWVWLLFCSAFFYAVLVPRYLYILLITILIDYTAGIIIGKVLEKKWKKIILLISISANLSFLIYFKYFNFLIENLSINEKFFGLNNQHLLTHLILPIGLSFHIFQSMSYIIEIYRGNEKPEKNIILYALYVLFFPQLVAGPIERPKGLLKQLRKKIAFNAQNIKQGLLLTLWGLSKKIIIADRLSIYVDEVFLDPSAYSFVGLILASVFFAFQIYCDFSGYSDMAIGIAKMLGIDLMVNFKTPYFSKNIQEFWQRWHISLSSWFKDYVYIPLGGNKKNNLFYGFNILVVFLLSGLWHGANWTYIIWGLIHGLALIAFIFNKKYNLIHIKNTILQQAFTFSFVCIAWVFFRAINLQQAIEIIASIFSFQDGIITSFYFNFNHLIFSIIIIIILIFIEKNKLQLLLNNNNFYQKILLYATTIYFLGIFNQAQFIYFQF